MDDHFEGRGNFTVLLLVVVVVVAIVVFIRLHDVLPRGCFATFTSSVLGVYVLLSKCSTRGMRLKPWQRLSSSLLIEII